MIEYNGTYEPEPVYTLTKSEYDRIKAERDLYLDTLTYIRDHKHITAPEGDIPGRYKEDGQASLAYWQGHIEGHEHCSKVAGNAIEKAKRVKA